MPAAPTPDSGLAGGADSACRIPHSRPALGAAELVALREVIHSGNLAQGPRVERLEQAVAEFLWSDMSGSGKGVATCSGTAGLYASLRALGIDEGDEVLLPAFVCASVLQAVRYTGATPRFVDCDPATFNLDPADAGRKLSARTKAVVVAHLFGLPADLEPLLELGPPVVEDCAQTIAAHYRGRRVGTAGRLSVCSLYATKLLAAGEGGMVLSEDESLLEHVRRLRNCDEPGSDEWAFNFKMSDLHAAVGLAQLRELPARLARRRSLAARYTQALEDLPVDVPAAPEGSEHQYFRYVVSVEQGILEPLLERCEEHHLACRRPVGYLPDAVCAELNDLPGCRQAWERACSIPLYPALTDEEATLAMSRFQTALGVVVDAS